MAPPKRTTKKKSTAKSPRRKAANSDDEPDPAFLAALKEDIDANAEIAFEDDAVREMALSMMSYSKVGAGRHEKKKKKHDKPEQKVAWPSRGALTADPSLGAVPQGGRTCRRRGR